MSVLHGFACDDCRVYLYVGQGFGPGWRLWADRSIKNAETFLDAHRGHRLRFGREDHIGEGDGYADADNAATGTASSGA